MELGAINNNAQAAATVPKTSAEGAVNNPSSTSAAAQPSTSPLQTANALKQTADVLNTEQVRQAAHTIADSLKSRARDLQFSVHEDLNRIVVKIIDPETKEVIRQIPAEEMLKLAKAIDTATGRLIKTSA